MNPIQLSIFAKRLAGLCDEMGAVLRRSALSPNIKGRLTPRRQAAVMGKC